MTKLVTPQRRTRSWKQLQRPTGATASSARRARAVVMSNDQPASQIDLESELTCSVSPMSFPAVMTTDLSWTDLHGAALPTSYTPRLSAHLLRSLREGVVPLASIHRYKPTSIHMPLVSSLSSRYKAQCHRINPSGHVSTGIPEQGKDGSRSGRSAQDIQTGRQRLTEAAPARRGST